MKIGELIHENGWTTYVSSGHPCTSSCSIIWLAGAPRTIEGAPAVIIGFHAIYNKETEQERVPLTPSLVTTLRVGD